MKWLKKMSGPFCLCALLLLSSSGRLSLMPLEKQAPDTIEAEIKGEVVAPDVYTIKNGATIQDLIAEAGGKTEGADLSRVSLQEEVKAHEVIVIAKKKADPQAQPIRITMASKEELMTLPGIGESTAQKILAYREEHGFFKLEDLMEVPGIGEKKFEKLKDRIAL
ncbi:helix-hairpin-helix domain-containing protein [Allobaculum fili]|uniref:helix-hairpin-helix domain-containing protein n=1 Tax=Allobaculum fili TaxID=2834460 RepID=UPI001E36A53F|nr:ComEA family DNA-binding protein [Allobaculum fili]